MGDLTIFVCVWTFGRGAWRIPPHRRHAALVDRARLYGDAVPDRPAELLVAAEGSRGEGIGPLARRIGILLAGGRHPRV